MLKKHIKKTQAGFTLIEIIAVLVILGILAAVAVPRFINLQTEAKNKAVEGALAAGQSNVTLVYSNTILNTGSAPTMQELATELSGVYTNVGDFTVSYAASGTNGINVTVTNGPTTGYLNDVTTNKTKIVMLQP